MKKYLMLTLLILSIGMILAVDSAPSSTVGYFKKSVAGNSWAAFSYPFYSSNDSIQYILGDQFSEGDAITDMRTSLGAEYFDGFGWYGDMQVITPGTTYWIARGESNPTTDYFLMGTVDPQIVDYTFPAGAWTAFALNEARDIAISTLPITGVTEGDAISDIGTGFGTEYFDGYGWYGDLEFIEPTHAYWYSSNSASDINWTYDPGARTATPTPLKSKSANKK